jgi:hypothetical protein
MGQIVHELRLAGGTGEMIAWLAARPSYCDRGRFHGIIEAPHVRSDADPSPRYYFDLDRGKAEMEAYLDAKRIDRADAEWVVREYGGWESLDRLGRDST